MLKLKEESKNKDSYNLNGDVIFSNVSVITENKSMLRDLNFIIQKGEKVAILGDNGSGKSLLSKAMIGFNEHNGNIYINNHNINRLNKSNIREYVELVDGNSYLFKGTILENVLLTNKQIKNLDKIFKDSEIYDDIQRFKEKENTLVGEKGAKLSGGQKQRISIARTLVNNKPIIIFDEALNKIDNNTKEKVLFNLIEKYNEKTMIFITHDLKITEHVDKVIYIDNNTTTVKDPDEMSLGIGAKDGT